MKIIIVDNEAIQISSLQKQIERVFPNAVIFIATKFDKAFETIRKHPKDCILFCTKDLPGMSGIKLIERLQAEKICSNYYYVLTYNSLTQDLKRSAVKAGTDRFIPKPYQIEDLLPILKNGRDFIEAKNDAEQAKINFKDLKETFDEEVLKIKEIIDLLLEERINGIIEKSQKIEEAALWIAKKYGIKDELELNDLKIASKLQFTGRLVLGDKFINEPVMKDGRLNDPIMKQIPEFAMQIVSKIKGYQNVKIIIENLYENYDGTGFPKGKMGNEIPKPSRILRVCTDLFEAISSGMKNDEATNSIVNESRRLYDHIPAAYIDQYFANFDKEKTRAEIPHSLKELTEGMTISRNIVTSEGLILLGKDTNLNEDNLIKLRQTAKTDGVIGDIYVYDIAGKEERNATDR